MGKSRADRTSNSAVDGSWGKTTSRSGRGASASGTAEEGGPEMLPLGPVSRASTVGIGAGTPVNASAVPNGGMDLVGGARGPWSDCAGARLRGRARTLVGESSSSR
jgi:hypothetical protein